MNKTFLKTNSVSDKLKENGEGRRNRRLYYRLLMIHSEQSRPAMRY